MHTEISLKWIRASGIHTIVWTLTVVSTVLPACGCAAGGNGIATEDDHEHCRSSLRSLHVRVPVNYLTGDLWTLSTLTQCEVSSVLETPVPLSAGNYSIDMLAKEIEGSARRRVLWWPSLTGKDVELLGMRMFHAVDGNSGEGGVDVSLRPSVGDLVGAITSFATEVGIGSGAYVERQPVKDNVLRGLVWTAVVSERDIIFLNMPIHYERRSAP